MFSKVHFCAYGTSTPLHSDSKSSELEPILVSADAAQQGSVRSNVSSHQEIKEKSNYYRGLRLQLLTKNVRDRSYFRGLQTQNEHQRTRFFLFIFFSQHIFFSKFVLNGEKRKCWWGISFLARVIHHLDLRLKHYLIKVFFYSTASWFALCISKIQRLGKFLLQLDLHS